MIRELSQVRVTLIDMLSFLAALLVAALPKKLVKSKARYIPKAS